MESSPVSSITNSAQSFKRQRRLLQELYEETRNECESQEKRADDLSAKLQKSREENEMLQSNLQKLSETAFLECQWSRRVEALEARLSTAQARVAEMESLMQSNADTTSKVQLHHQMKIRTLEEQIAEKVSASDANAAKCEALDSALLAVHAQLADAESQNVACKRRSDSRLAAARLAARECMKRKSQILNLRMDSQKNRARRILQKKKKKLAMAQKKLCQYRRKFVAAKRDLLSTKDTLAKTNKKYKFVAAERDLLSTREAERKAGNLASKVTSPNNNQAVEGKVKQVSAISLPVLKPTVPSKPNLPLEKAKTITPPISPMAQPKDIPLPKPASTAYNIWRRENSNRRWNNVCRARDISRMAGAEWRDIADKSEWVKKAKEDKKRYEREMEAYRSAK